MDYIFNTDYIRFSQSVFNDIIATDWNTLSINFSKSSLVDELSDRLEVRVTPCNVWLTNSQHVDGGLVEFYKYSIVNLQEPEELEYFTYFRGHFVDTTKKNNVS